ncbi:MAG: hypothetical protein N2109_12740 [Fimbriimonadales bacterium]|nr:hypothetical protein [Fimbriimonadales bacterium]
MPDKRKDDIGFNPLAFDVFGNLKPGYARPRPPKTAEEAYRRRILAENAKYEGRSSPQAPARRPPPADEGRPADRARPSAAAGPSRPRAADGPERELEERRVREAAYRTGQPQMYDPAAMKIVPVIPPAPPGLTGPIGAPASVRRAGPPPRPPLVSESILQEAMRRYDERFPGADPAARDAVKYTAQALFSAIHPNEIRERTGLDPVEFVVRFRESPEYARMKRAIAVPKGYDPWEAFQRIVKPMVAAAAKRFMESLSAAPEEAPEPPERKFVPVRGRVGG